MKRFRQLFSILLAGCMLCSMTACTDKKQTVDDVSTSEITEEEITETESTTQTLADEEGEIEGNIVVWVKNTQLTKTKFAEYKKKFEAENPGVTIEYKVVSNYETTGYNLIIKDQAADVVMIPKCMTKDEIKEHFIPFGTTEEIAGQYKEAYIHDMDYNGVVYGIPEYIMPQGIAYNKRVLEYAGVVELPTTPEEFLALLKQIQLYDEEIIPCYVDETALEDWQAHVWGSVAGDADYHYNGMVMETNPFSEDSPNYIVHKLLYDIVYNRYCQSANIEMSHARKMFNRGDIACMLVDFDELSKLQKAGTNPDDIGYMPFPYNIDGVQYATATYGYCYGIPLNSENKTTAEAFVQYMINESGYAASEGAISLKKKSSRPVLLDNFSKVTLVIDNPPMADKEGKYEELCEKSGILLEDADLKLEIIEVAARTRPEQNDKKEEEELTEFSKEVSEELSEEFSEELSEEGLPQNFDEIMNTWYEKWKKAK